MYWRDLLRITGIKVHQVLLTYINLMIPSLLRSLSNQDFTLIVERVKENYFVRVFMYVFTYMIFVRPIIMHAAPARGSFHAAYIICYMCICTCSTHVACLWQHACGHACRSNFFSDDLTHDRPF